MQRPKNIYQNPFLWLLVLLVAAALVKVATYCLKQLADEELTARRISLINMVNAWEDAGRPADDALANFGKKFPSVFVTNLVLIVDGKSMQAIFAQEAVGRGLLLVTTNSEVILLRPGRSPQLLSLRGK